VWLFCFAFQVLNFPTQSHIHPYEHAYSETETQPQFRFLGFRVLSIPLQYEGQCHRVGAKRDLFPVHQYARSWHIHMHGRRFPSLLNAGGNGRFRRQ
jgi:hypothetical protein